jgi:hypothetical protein
VTDQTDTAFTGGRYLTPQSPPPVYPPESPTATIQTPPAPFPASERPDPFYVEGLRNAVHMFAPADGTHVLDQKQDSVLWGNITRYADAMAAYLRTRSRGTG